MFGESPGACPFVALEQDRDRRSDLPDYRHRCYAEPTPAPRAMAHQEAYCLSPNFSACPVFQDWAVRAAARPVPVPAGYQGRDAGALAAADAAADEAASVEDQPDSDAPLDATRETQERRTDEAITAAAVAAAGVAAADDFSADESFVTRNEQLGAFDHTAEPEVAPPDAGFEAEEQLPPAPAPLIGDDDDIPSMPPFLADRPGAAAAAAAAIVTPEPSVVPPAVPPRGSIGTVPSADKVRREDVVPSWEIDGRFGAQPGDEPPDDRFGGWLTALAVIAILALGVAGVIFLPGLLAGGPARTAAPTSSIGPTASVPFQTSTPLPSFTVAPATATATPGEPTAEPTPAATPRLYRIKSGDTLAKIARRNGITVADILAANPEISDPNQIQVGRFIIIPLPLPTAAP